MPVQNAMDPAHIKNCVKKIMEQESALLEHSPIWQTCANLLSYLLDLSPEHLRNVRIHTDVFTGESLNAALFAALNKHDPKGYAESQGYTFATEELAKEYWLSEPPIDHWFQDGTFGCHYQDRVINVELSRYQLYMENFISSGMVEEIKNSSEKKVVMEIGAGYGALGHHLMNLTRHNVCYLVVDLPLMLLYTGYYIMTHHPQAKIFIYDPENPAHQLLDDRLLEYDLVLIPNHRLSILKNVSRIDYAINNISMAEMTEKQVEEYIDFIKPRLTHYFYFQNYAWGYAKPLHIFIGEHFAARPNLDFYDNYLKTSGRPASFPAKTFFYTAKPEARTQLADSLIKLRLPDHRLAKLNLGTEEILIRKSPKNYVPFAPNILDKIPYRAAFERVMKGIGRRVLQKMRA